LSEADLASHTSTWDQPLWVDYHGTRLWECPPNAGTGSSGSEPA
jgi:gamma-glutamyltranspeptidase